MGTKKEVARTTDESVEELMASSITSLTANLTKASETIDLLTKKVTSMACHIIALEALLSEVVTVTGVDLAAVNRRIRGSVAVDPTTRTDADVVIDIAASIASRPRC